MAEHHNCTIIQRLFERFNDGDLDGAATLVTADFELTDLPTNQTFYGPIGLRQWLGTFLSAGPDARANLVRIIVSGEWAATEHVGQFTHTGPLQTPAGIIEPTGRHVQVSIAEFYQLRDGSILRLRAYYDLASMLRQLGVADH